MPELQKLTVRVLGDVTDLRSKMSKAEKTMEQFGYNMKRTGQALTAGLTLPIAAVGTAATKMASDAEEAAAKFETVMGDSAVRVRERFEELHNIIPLTMHEMEGLSASVQDLLVPMGVARDRAADMSAEFVSLAGDIGAFNNLHPEQVMKAFMSALSGEAEPVRRFGVDVRKVALEAIALEHGLIQAGEAMDRTAQAQAVLIAITQDSQDAIGAAAREAENAAAQFKFFMRNVKELAVTIGEQLLPVVTPLVKRMNEMISGAGGLSSNFVQWGVAIGAVLAALGPLLLVAGKLVQTFVALRVAGMAALPFFGIGGALVLGLGALAAHFIKGKLEAAEFASELRKVASDARSAASALNDMSKEQVASLLAGRLNAMERLKSEQERMIAEQRERLAGRGQFGVGGVFSDAEVAETFTGKQKVAFQNLERAIESTTGAVAGLLDQLDNLDAAAPGVGGGTTGGSGGATAARRIFGLANSRSGLASQGADLVRLIAEHQGGAGRPGAGSMLDTSIAGRVEARDRTARRTRREMPEEKQGMVASLLQPLQALGPQALALGAVFEIMKGAMEPLRPMLEALKEPLQQIGHLFGMVLAPVVEVLSISMTGLMKAVSVVMQGFGWFVEALGWLIDKIIGWFSDWGEKLQDWGKELQRTSKAMREGTYEREAETQAIQAATRAINAPSGFKMALARFNATNADGASGTPATSGGAGTNGGAPRGRSGASPIHIDHVEVVGSSDPREGWENFVRSLEYGARSGDPLADRLNFGAA